MRQIVRVGEVEPIRDLYAIENLNIFSLVLSVYIIRCSEERNHLCIFYLIDAVLAYLGHFLYGRDQNDIEAFQESDETKDAIGQLHWCGYRAILCHKWSEKISLKCFLVICSEVFLDDSPQLILISLVVAHLQNFDHLLASEGLICADQDKKLLGLLESNLAQIERSREKIYFGVHF